VTLLDDSARPSADLLASYPDLPLPPAESRLPAARDHLKPGLKLGTLKRTLDMLHDQPSLLDKLSYRLPLHLGRGAAPHPYTLLALANRSLKENVKLGPWIHLQC